ncbi:MAG TPA: glycine cleavage system protein GcvH [Intrasporangium sp.]|uniref:glycine cleavage system protein GcvH n=1 Tax=Intrasporangium sp. TaxID=1925024 RepID=UPI002B47F2AF|nr:glycine cleavage system protein GcvH [Intrasporangium sp.]HKX68415.1 glycine cleavage system protein GcvH [Intrasporangium sp.]
MSDLDYPSDLRYTSDHEWIREGDEDNVVRVGITSFAQDALGDVVYVSLPAVGDSVAAGDACGEVESTKSVSDIYAPLAGEVTAVNDALDTTPELVNSDPYGEGWMFELRIEDRSALDGLLDSAGYVATLT